ncbi:MAG: fluoride exporter, partial [Actinomycetota bacterium]|nr:fluoride exporter [Actinomycetota bacterium]
MSETAVSETSHWRAEAPVIAAISAGGALGAVARYGITEGIGHSPGAFAWATLIVNVVGCLLIGVLMGVIARVGVGRLVRPFLG